MSVLETSLGDDGVAYRARVYLRTLLVMETKGDLSMEGERALMAVAFIVTGDTKHLDRMELKRDALEKVKAAELAAGRDWV